MKIENNVLTVGEVSIPLGLVASAAKVRVWRVPAAYRENGLFVAVDLAGQPSEVPACSHSEAEYLGELEYEADDSLQLSASKAAKLMEINALCNGALSDLAATYPSGEIQSWSRQVKEADLYAADPTVATPMLSAIAEARGMTVAEMVERVTANSIAYSAASGALIGRRLAAEDALSLAATPEQVAGVSW